MRFANQTSICNSKCHRAGDLGTAECTWRLTLSFPEPLLQIPVAPGGAAEITEMLLRGKASVVFVSVVNARHATRFVLSSPSWGLRVTLLFLGNSCALEGAAWSRTLGPRPALLLLSLPPKGQRHVKALTFLLRLLTGHLSLNVLVTDTLPWFGSDTRHPLRRPGPSSVCSAECPSERCTRNPVRWQHLLSHPLLSTC